MSSAAQTLEYTPEEYLALDEAAPEGRRWEYDGAHVYLMAGTSPEHNRLTHNISRHLGNRLVPRGCSVMQSEQRVQVGCRYTYPDVVAFCEEGRFTGDEPATLLNPGLVVEVLSGSTMERDLTWKLSGYREIASVREVWIVWAEQVRIDQYVRRAPGGDGSSSAWTLRAFEEKEVAIRSEAFGLEVPVTDLYELVL